jgi:4-amino-4-deoxy-L-arabinose transferase-like glycosyltransferase
LSIPSFLDRVGDWSAAWRYGLLTIIALAFFLPGISTLPPIDRDESRFAQATKQMVQTGDYIDIRFQEKPRHKKPAGIYWMQAVSVHLTGVQDAIWAYRIPSLIGAVGAVLLTAAIGGMLFGTGVGFAAGVIMAGSVLLNVEARTAKTDAMLLAVTLAALACLIRVWQRRERPTANAYGFWAALGLGFMIKGPILFLPVAGLTLASGWHERSLRWLGRLKPLTGVLLFLLLAAPWYVAIAIISDGGFFAESVGKDLVAKVASGQESHGAPPGLYLALAPVTFWPFSLLGLLALPWIWRNRRRAEVWVLLGWALVTWIVFAATPTKLAHYVLPAYPALAILGAAALYEGEQALRWWRWIAFLLWALITLALAGAMPVLTISAGQNGFDPFWFSGVLLLPVIWAGLRLSAGGRGTVRHLIVVLVGAGVFTGIVFGRFLPNLDPVFISPRLASMLPEMQGCERPKLASAGYNEPSLVFLTHTETNLTSGESAADHLAAEPACGVAAVERRHMQAFLDRVAESGEKVLAVGALDGFNYARGKKLLITLYIADPRG